MNGFETVIAAVTGFFLGLAQDPRTGIFCLGAGAGTLCSTLVFLLLALRVQRRQWTTALRAERLQEQARTLELTLDQVQDECHSLQRECRQLDTDNASLRTACSALQQQIKERSALLAETRQQIEQDFKVLARQVLGEQGEQLTGQHSAALTLLLQPLHQQLRDFKNKVEAVYDLDARDRVSILKEIEHLKQLNQQISAEANNLADALRGSNKLQGQWGEMVLAKLLEASGMRKGREFALQVALKNDSGATLQPDALVYLPDNRTIVIDAKVSLKAYAEAHTATEETVREQQIRLHLDSVKRQIGLLAGKQYQHLTGTGSLDFVLLFIPIEGAFQLTVARDPEILLFAMQRQVLLASPSTLLAILRTVHHLWRLDEQNRNSLAIAKQAGNLYDKFVIFTEAFEEIGLRLNQTQQAWHTARNRLSTGQGNLIDRTQALKDLGVQSSKQLPDALKPTATSIGEQP